MDAAFLYDLNSLVCALLAAKTKETNNSCKCHPNQGEATIVRIARLWQGCLLLRADNVSEWLGASCCAAATRSCW